MFEANYLELLEVAFYRLRLERDGNRVRLITHGGHNWADRQAVSLKCDLS